VSAVGIPALGGYHRGMLSKSATEAELLAAAGASAQRVATEMRLMIDSWPSSVDQSQWRDGQALLSTLHASAEAVARQIDLSSRSDHP